jgi:hypothetical protein
MRKLVFGCLFLCSCASSNLSLLSVTSQSWIGGRQETGSGTNYRIKLIAPESNNYFHIQKVCIENVELNFNTLPKAFEKGDTVSLNGRKATSHCSTLSIGVVHYQLKGCNDSLIISNIQKLPQLFYP